MGTRDNYETVTRVIQAFAGKHTWQQAELARHVGVQPRALRRLLLSLLEAGMPLEREEEHPHAYWSVPPRWFPGGVIFDAEDWPVLVHAVLGVANQTRREKLLSRLLAGRRVFSNSAALERLGQAVTATPLSAEEHEMVLLIEQALLESVPLGIHYYSASSGRLAWRVVSPQKLITEPKGRMAAYCHTHNALRWFRVDNIQRARLERDHQPHEVPKKEIDAFLAASVDGFHDGAEQELAFRVREPECSWVRGNLLPGMTVDHEARGGDLRVVTRGAPLVVARFIVGLGGAAVAEGEPLRALVLELARGATGAHLAGEE